MKDFSRWLRHTRRFLENITEDGDDAPALPADDYDVEVTEARPIEGKKVMFLDLKVLTGPDANKTTSVSLYVPEDGEKAVYHFKKKTRGLAQQLASVPANIDDDEVMQAIADAVTGARIRATLGIQSKGDYAGSQELNATKPLDGAAPAPAAAPSAPPVATAPAANGVPVGGDAAVAVAPAPAPVDEPAF